MYNNIKDKSRVITGQRVTRIEELEDYAIVHTDNGMSAKCQLVAGCDGVRSFVRQQIAKEIGDPNSNGPNCTLGSYFILSILSGLSLNYS